MIKEIQISSDRYFVLNGEKKNYMTSFLFRNDGFEVSFLCDESLGKEYLKMEGNNVDAHIWNKEKEKVEREFNNVKISLVEVLFPIDGAITVRVCSGVCDRSNYMMDGLHRQISRLERIISRKND
jgi:hypothetical protein